MNGKRSCPKCNQTTKLTRHHILVKRFFGSPDNAPILLICRTCHTELEKLIPEHQMQTVEFYWEVIFYFLNTNKIRVVEWNGKRSYTVRRDDEMHSLQEVIGNVIRELPGQKVSQASVLRHNADVVQDFEGGRVN